MFPVCCVQTNIEVYICGDDSEPDKVGVGGGGVSIRCFSGYLFLHSILKAYRDLFALIPFS